MKRRRGTDWLLIGYSDFQARNDQANRPTDTYPLMCYLDGWRSAALDDLARRRLAAAVPE